MKDKEVISKLLKELEGLDWFFVSGTAVHFYTEGEREFGDIDIVLRRSDMDEFASRMGAEPKEREIEKGDFRVKDYAFETDFSGQRVEAISVLGERKPNFERMFNNGVEVTYKGNRVFLEPLENILVYKTEIGREKDIRDLKLLLKKEDQIDRSFLREILKDKEDRKGILRQLRKIGYDIE